MNRLILLIVCLCLTACGAKTLKNYQGMVEGELYYSISREFVVGIPYFEGVEIHDNTGKDSEWVDFQFGKDDWSRYGGYSLEWISNDKPAKNFGEFINKSDQLIRGSIKLAIDPGTQFNTLRQRSFAVNGKQAKQVIGRITKESKPAIYAATVINFSDRIAMGIVIYSLKEEPDFKKYPAWQRYVRFMESIRRL